jgi:outer membrane protein assembly factor BamC
MFCFFKSKFSSIIQITVFCLVSLALSGCSSIPFFDGSSDYESLVKKNKPKKLEMPPDLITPAKDRKFSIPSSGSTMSEFESFTKQNSSGSGQENILPSVEGMKIRSYGNHRVLIVEKPVEYLWPILRTFWLDSGFIIARENPQIGLIETDWFEDRKNLPQGFIRGVLGKVFDNIYDTGERDRYKMRLERISDNETEISVAHRGLIEVVADRPDGTISWAIKPTDRKLEEDYLKKIMIALGANEQRAGKLIKDKDASSEVLFNSDDSATYIEIFEDFDRSWRRVGMAIDRLEFSVEDRVRSEGTYYIKYRDPTIGTKKKGFLSKLFSFGDSPEKIQTYKVKISSSNKLTKVFVTDQQGNSNSPITKSITSILFGQLK